MKPRRTTPVKWRRIIPLTFAALLVPFAVGYAFAVFVMFPAPKVEPGSDGIAVPSLIGHTTAEAEEMLRAAGLGAIDSMVLPHPDARAGSILAQDPLPGQQLRAGSTVRVSVSGGAPQLRVPDLEGFTADAADQMLKRMGFETRRSEETSVTRVGAVTRLEPMAGASIRLPATVTIWVSSGMPADTFVLPPDTLR